MEDLHYAGGIRALLAQLKELLHLEEQTVNGRSLGENIADAEVYNADVIRTMKTALSPRAAWPSCAATSPPTAPSSRPPPPIRSCCATPAAPWSSTTTTIWPRASTTRPSRRRHSVLVLRNAGPLGGPGFPEWGMLPIPKKLLKQGVRDMVRLSDARMSGTSYGCCILHVAPESSWAARWRW
jgi:dihydroxy-acid dehydratase